MLCKNRLGGSVKVTHGEASPPDGQMDAIFGSGWWWWWRVLGQSHLPDIISLIAASLRLVLCRFIIGLPNSQNEEEVWSKGRFSKVMMVSSFPLFSSLLYQSFWDWIVQTMKLRTTESLHKYNAIIIIYGLLTPGCCWQQLCWMWMYVLDRGEVLATYSKKNNLSKGLLPSVSSDLSQQRW